MANHAQNRNVQVFFRRFQSTTPSLRDTPPVQEGNRVGASERSFSENLTALPIEGSSFFISNQETLALSLPSHPGIKEITKPTKNAQNGPLLSF